MGISTIHEPNIDNVRKYCDNLYQDYFAITNDFNSSLVLSKKTIERLILAIGNKRVNRGKKMFFEACLNNF